MDRQQITLQGEGYRVMATPHFLVPIDFSEYANQSLDYAITLADKLGARVTLLHVIEPLPLGGMDMGVILPATYFQDLEAEIGRDLESLLERVTAGRTGCSSGNGQPNRTSPPHRPVSRAKTPSAMRGKRAVLRMCCMRVYSSTCARPGVRAAPPGESPRGWPSGPVVVPPGGAQSRQLCSTRLAHSSA